MITRSFAVLFASIVAASFSLGGCAADSDPSGDETQVQVKTEVATPSEGEVAPNVFSKTFYTANITRADIIAGGGTCTGNLCSINGRLYDCTGGGLCSPAS